MGSCFVSERFSKKIIKIFPGFATTFNRSFQAWGEDSWNFVEGLKTCLYERPHGQRHNDRSAALIWVTLGAGQDNRGGSTPHPPTEMAKKVLFLSKVQSSPFQALSEVTKVAAGSHWGRFYSTGVVLWLLFIFMVHWIKAPNLLHAFPRSTIIRQLLIGAGSENQQPPITENLHGWHFWHLQNQWQQAQRHWGKQEHILLSYSHLQGQLCNLRMKPDFHNDKS